MSITITREMFSARLHETVADMSRSANETRTEAMKGIEAVTIGNTGYAIFDDELKARRVYMKYTMFGSRDKFSFFQRSDGKFIVTLRDISIDFSEDE